MANEPWASDAAYPAGSDPWSGQATKVAPGLAEIAAGHTPGVPVPAETENWWKNRADTRLAALEGELRAVRTKIIPAIGGMWSITGGVVDGKSIVRTGASGGSYYRPLEFDAGTQFVNIRVRLKENAGGTFCQARLLRDVDGVQTPIADIGTSDGSATYQTLELEDINHEITVGGQYVIAFTFSGGAANCDLNRIEIDYTTPAP